MQLYIEEKEQRGWLNSVLSSDLVKPFHVFRLVGFKFGGLKKKDGTSQKWKNKLNYSNVGKEN